VLPVPRARDLRIRLVPLASHPNPNYFGETPAGQPPIQEGMPTSLATHNNKGQEASVFDSGL
jgi:hypothetical protein